MGLIDTVFGTALSGYLGFKLFNTALERLFFTRIAQVSSTGMPVGSLAD